MGHQDRRRGGHLHQGRLEEKDDPHFERIGNTFQSREEERNKTNRYNSSENICENRYNGRRRERGKKH